MRDTTVKVHIYAPDVTQAAQLAATMNLHLLQWEWFGEYPYTPDITWADVSPLYDRIDFLEEKLQNWRNFR